MLIDDFLTYIRAERRYSENTAKSYERDVNLFIKYLGERQPGLTPGNFDPSAVAPDDIRDWIVSLSESGLSASSVNRMASSLRTFYRWLRKTGAMEKDLFTRIRLQKRPSRLPAYIPESQLHILITELSAELGSDDFKTRRNALMVLLFYSTGVRLEELRGIRIGDFSGDFSELLIRGKGDKERVVPVLGMTRRKIVEYIDSIKAANIWPEAGNFLFLTEKGKPVSRTSINGIVKDELARAGVQGKRNPHMLRHTFATHLLNDGADIREIQELLGHNSLAATQVYTHNSITQLKQAYQNAHPRAEKGKIPENEGGD